MKRLDIHSLWTMPRSCNRCACRAVVGAQEKEMAKLSMTGSEASLRRCLGWASQLNPQKYGYSLSVEGVDVDKRGSIHSIFPWTLKGKKKTNKNTTQQNKSQATKLTHKNEGCILSTPPLSCFVWCQGIGLDAGVLTGQVRRLVSRASGWKHRT